MTIVRILSPVAFSFLLLALTPAWASPEGADTVSDAQAKVVLEYWHKQCDHSTYPDCAPGGIDLEKNQVRVLDRDLAQRKADIHELESQTLKDEGKAHNDVALFLRYCQAPAAPKYQVDIALYKVRPTHAWEIAKTVTEKMWELCNGYDKRPETQAAIRLFQKVTHVDVRFTPQPFEGAVDYDFDDKTGTLIVKALDKSPLPNSSSVDFNWTKFLRNH